MTKREKEIIELLVDEFRDSITKKFNNAKVTCLNSRGAESSFHMYASCVADYFCIDKEKMLSTQTRLTDYRLGRQILWWLCRTGESALPFSLNKIGLISGGFHHATVLHGANRISDDIGYDFQAMNDTKSICKLLGFEVDKVGMKYTTKRNETIPS